MNIFCVVSTAAFGLFLFYYLYKHGAWFRKVLRSVLEFFNELKWILFVLLILLLLAWLFAESNGVGIDLSKKINVNIWASYGTFIGAFLLAATLLFQIRSFKKQQVEAKFFELVKYYRDNVAEMRFRNPFYYEENIDEDKIREAEEKYVEGRRVAKTIFDQYKIAYHIIKKYNTIGDLNIYHLLKDKKQYCKFFTPNFPRKSREICHSQKRRFLENEISYLIVFWGVVSDSIKDLQDSLGNQFVSDIYLNYKDQEESNRLINKFRTIIAVYDCENPASYRKNLKSLSRFPECGNNYKSKIKFFGGHQYHLGHYFRHLYQAVNFIDDQPFWLFNKKEKYNYVKTLRAQMSNYEQALIFINSLTDLGRKWEYKNKEGKSLISTYNLIKNLPKNFVPDMNPKDYYPGVKFEWEEANKSR